MAFKEGLKIVNRAENHIQIFCQCHKYVHDVEPGDDGEPKYNFFLINDPEVSAPGAIPGRPGAVRPPKKKPFFLFRDISGDDGEEGEEESSTEEGNQ